MNQTEFCFAEPFANVKKKRVRPPAYYELRKLRYRENAEERKAEAKAYRLANPDKIRERNKRYSAKNKEKVAEWSKKSRQKNHERCKRYSSEYFQKNKERSTAKNSRWQKENRERIAELSKARRIKNHEATLAREKAWRDAAPERVAIAQRRRRMKKLTNSSREEIIAADAKIAAMRAIDFSKCSYCDKILRSKLMHVDHIFPINKGGKHSAENIQLACKNCNSQKSDKILHIEWIPPKDRRPAAEDIEPETSKP